MIYIKRQEAKIMPRFCRKLKRNFKDPISQQADICEDTTGFPKILVLGIHAISKDKLPNP